MTDRSRPFVKHYEHVARRDSATRHLKWLESLHAVSTPRLIEITPNSLIFENLGDEVVSPDDLTSVAETIARLHAVAYRKELHRADLRFPHKTEGGLIIEDFISSRVSLDANAISRTLSFPAAIYMDANVRNFVKVAADIFIVDFDDLSLAPFGYDLAKLVVSNCMTQGEMKNKHVLEIIDSYNRRVFAECGLQSVCAIDNFKHFTEMHWALTAKYLGTNGYKYPWPDVRPQCLV